MNAKLYEILVIFTSFFILIGAISLFFKYRNLDTNDIIPLVIVLILSAIFSILMRSYRLKNNICGQFCNHPLFYADIFFALLTFCIALTHRVLFYWKSFIIFAGILMVFGAIVPHYDYLTSSYYLHLSGHIIICLILLYTILYGIRTSDNTSIKLKN